MYRQLSMGPQPDLVAETKDTAIAGARDPGVAAVPAPDAQPALGTA